MCDNDTVEQHYVAITYLRPWASRSFRRKHLVHVHSKVGKPSEERRTSKIMKENDIHTDFQEKRQRDLKWECYFRSLENDYVIARNNLEKTGTVFNEDDRDTFLRLISAQAHRTPRTRGLLQNSLVPMKNVQNKFQADIPFFFNAQNPRRYSHSEIDQALDNPMTYILLREIDFLHSSIREMNISLIKTSSILGFITSDNPVILAIQHHNSE